MRHIQMPLMTLAVLALIGAAGVLADEPAVNDLDLIDTEMLLEESPQAYDYGFSRWYRESRSRWSVGAGAVILHRNDPAPRTLLVDPQDGSELMNTLDLRPGWGAGPRFEITKHFDRGVDFEVELFNIDNWSNRAQAQNATTATSGGFWDEFVFDDVQAYYSTEVFNLELNLRWPLFGSRWLKGVAGFRYVNLNEEFSTNVSLTQPPFPTPFTEWGKLKLDNNLYGFQLGIEPVLWNPCGPIRLDGFLKAGIYGNDANWLLTTGGDLDTRRCQMKGCHTAFIGELALLATYAPCCCCCCSTVCRPVCRPWAVFAGYEALWLEGVATAEQAKHTLVYDKAFYHGFIVGLEISLGRRCGCRCR